MKINFIVPALNLNGGTRVIAIYADLLAKRGHHVTVISPGENVPSHLQRIKSFVKGKKWKITRIFTTEYFRELDVNLKILDTYRPVIESDVPDADIVIATFWTTAEWVSKFSLKKGRKVYFIQGYEVFPNFPIDRVNATYHLPYKKIVISKWLENVIKEQSHDNSVSLVLNGVDTKQFFSGAREKNTIPTIGLVYNTATIKGCDVAFKSIEAARKVIPNLKLVTFGHDMPTTTLPLPANTEYFFQPDQMIIKDIYAKCDAWLFPSRSDGFGLPILEAMACRTPVIGTTAGAAPELLANGAGFLVDIDDTKMMANAIIQIARMSVIDWSNLSDRAYYTAQQHTWDKSVVLLENQLKSELEKNRN